MKTNQPSISNKDLHAFVDGQLEASRIQAVKDYLKENPEAMKQVKAYHQINQMLHTQFDSVLEEPIPPYLTDRLEEKVRINWLQAAAVAGLMIFSGYLGWIIKENQTTPEIITVVHLVEPATFAHTIYTPEVNHPVEVKAEEKEHMSQWLSKRMQANINVPNLSGYGFELLGGRLLPSLDRMACQMMYEDANGNRVTLYIRRGSWDSKQTAFRYSQQDNMQVIYWIDGDFGYALVGDLTKQDLTRLSHATYQQLTI